ncbi:ATP-binding protein [Streptomyces sp. NPDC090021]|uniref:ATP-binding protein n=1 Tax=Streptomyces sp. NPDC090021 TaxID=3365919 RepID=UPI00382EB611
MDSARSDRCTIRVESAPYDTITHATREALNRSMTERGWINASRPDSPAYDSALLVATELVVNACRHADGPEEVRLIWEGTDLTIEVDDTAPGRPCPRAVAERGETGGFGMAIIADLSEDWGVRVAPEGRGKTVYARLACREGRATVAA